MTPDPSKADRTPMHTGRFIACSTSRRRTVIASIITGFTLVEMLVVVAILAVLMAIILPVVSRAMESGRATSCTSQMRQIGKALQLYIDDYNLRPPKLASLSPAYVSDRRLFLCPSDRWISDGGWAWSNWGKYTTPLESWPFPISYGFFFPRLTVATETSWEKIKVQPGRPGYLVCVLHGQSTGSGLSPGDAHYFKGRFLRLCFDGSVVTRQFDDRRRFSTWKYLTDQDKEPPD